MGRKSRKDPFKITDQIMKDKKLTDGIIRAMTFDSANDKDGFSFFVADKAFEEAGIIYLKTKLTAQPFMISKDDTDVNVDEPFSGGCFTYEGNTYAVCCNGKDVESASKKVLNDIIAEFVAAKKIHTSKDILEAIKGGKEKEKYFLATR